MMQYHHLDKQCLTLCKSPATFCRSLCSILSFVSVSFNCVFSCKNKGHHNQLYFHPSLIMLRPLGLKNEWGRTWSLTVMHSGLANMLHQIYRKAKQWRIPSVKLSQCKKSCRNKLEFREENCKCKYKIKNVKNHQILVKCL